MSIAAPPAGAPGMSAAPAPEAASVPLPAAAPASVEGVAPTVADLPTQKGPKGILFDFNDGCRVVLPEAEQPWRVRLSDLDTGNVLFETELKAGRINSTKRYYVRFRIEVWQQGESVFAHDYSAAGRDVLVRFPVDTLGDPLGWFPYAARFKDRHGCRLTCMMNGKMSGLLRSSYPDINFLTESEIKPEGFYATYSIAVFYQGGTMFDHKDCVPCDFRRVGLHRAAGYILGVDPREEPPRIALADERRPIADPYVCIAVQSTLQAKYWNNPTGWAEIVRFLKESGYRVICIDLKSTHGKGRRSDRRPAADRAGALAQARRVLHRTLQRAVMACLVDAHARGDDQRRHPSDQRIHYALPRDQLSCVQQLLERSAVAVRPQRFFDLPAAQGYAAAIRVFAAHHRGAGEADDQAHTGLRSLAPGGRVMLKSCCTCSNTGHASPHR
jgi:autotransporter strand-loop-strand O-heptosyltransferase